MMHDLLRDMGREIVRERCPQEPSKRSRLWLDEEVIDILTMHEVRTSSREKINGKKELCLFTCVNKGNKCMTSYQ